MEDFRKNAMSLEERDGNLTKKNNDRGAGKSHSLGGLSRTKEYFVEEALTGRDLLRMGRCWLSMKPIFLFIFLKQYFSTNQ